MMPCDAICYEIGCEKHGCRLYRDPENKIKHMHAEQNQKAIDKMKWHLKVLQFFCGFIPSGHFFMPTEAFWRGEDSSGIIEYNGALWRHGPHECIFCHKPAKIFAKVEELSNGTNDNESGRSGPQHSSFCGSGALPQHGTKPL